MYLLLELRVNISDVNLNIAVVNGTFNARKLLESLKKGEKNYDFIEVMACSGGCIAGGGQPKFDLMQSEEVKNARSATLYKTDLNNNLRFSHKNIDVIRLYDQFLEKPLSKKSRLLLHTNYVNREEILNKKINV